MEEVNIFVYEAMDNQKSILPKTEIKFCEKQIIEHVNIHERYLSHDLLIWELINVG